MTNALKPTPTNIDAVGIESISKVKTGGRSADLKRWLGIAAFFIAGVILVSFIYSYMQRSKEQEKEKAKAIQGQGSAQVATRRDDLGAPAALPPPPATVESTPKVVPKPPCTPSQAKTLGGEPILGKDGKPVVIDCEGKSVNGNTILPPPPVTMTPNPANTVQTPPKPNPLDRFRGDVFSAGLTNGAASVMNNAQGGVARGSAQIQAASQGLAGRSAGAVSSTGSATVAGNGMPDQKGSVAGLLNSTNVAMVSASHLGSPSLMIPQGHLIPCTLTTQIVSEVSGFATCVLSENVYSADGKTVLLDRGSVAIGEYVAGIAQGTRRLHVLWNRIRTPANITVNISSPGASPLGVIGLNGTVDNRWFDRLGAALMLSLVQDGLSYAINKAQQPDIPAAAAGQYVEGKPVTSATEEETTTYQNEDGSTTVKRTTRSTGSGSGYVIQPGTQNLSFTAGASNTQNTIASMADKVLSSTINIRPVLRKAQGDRITIFVARDVQFDRVYSLAGNR